MEDRGYSPSEMRAHYALAGWPRGHLANAYSHRGDPMTDLPIYSMPSDEGEILATPIRPRDGTDLKAMWEKLEEAYARRADYETCSSCGLLVPLDPRGDVVDSGGRCVECQS